MMEHRQASNFYPHFEKEERPTIDYFVGLFNRLQYTHEPILTDFLDPRQRYILRTVIGSSALIQEFGGYKDSEKRRVYLSEDWAYITADDFDVQLLEIVYSVKFSELKHNQILGTLANSGVKLDTFGDIVTDGNGRWQLFIEASLTDFFVQQINRIGRTKVRLNPLPLGDIISVEDNSIVDSAVSASMRLDTVLSSITNKSRSQLKNNFEERNVRLNWHVEMSPEKIINVDDLISLRHFGRIKILNIQPTKKGKLRLEYRLWKSNNR